MYYLIISNGSYSDRIETYWIGDREITQSELNFEVERIGNEMLEEYESLPDHYNHYKRVIGKVDPNTGDSIRRPTAEIQQAKLKGWLLKQGYRPISKYVPEINFHYDLIISPDKRLSNDD